jgi:hypothetical protein
MPSPRVGQAASGTKVAFVVESIEHSREAHARWSDTETGSRMTAVPTKTPFLTISVAKYAT